MREFHISRRVCVTRTADAQSSTALKAQFARSRELLQPRQGNTSDSILTHQSNQFASMYKSSSGDPSRAMALYGFNWPFVAHIVVETPACINFMFNPSGQLGNHTPNAHAIIRQYALLLLSSILIAMLLITRDLDKLSGQIAGALAVYHVGPSIRAFSRCWNSSSHDSASSLWKAPLYMLVHTICLAGLLQCSWTYYISVDWLSP